MDMSQYKDLFISEVREHLAGMNKSIMDLESAAGDRDAIDTLFRMAHSIKGMAASMGYEGIAELAHKMEDLMDRVRKGTFAFAAGIADLLLEGTDLLTQMVDDVAAGGTGGGEYRELVHRLVDYTPVAATVPFEETAEETSPEEPASSPRKGPEETVSDELRRELRRREPDALQTVRVRTRVLDTLINITGELITSKNRLASISRKFAAANLDSAVGDLSRHIRELHDEVLKVRLMPFGAITERMPRMIRDLARKTGREAVLRIEGAEIELDRGILEELSDPLVHILRNAVDHGLEPPEDRIAAGKKPAGTITVEARKEKDRLLVTVTDDGRGMDPVRISTSAVEKGLISREEAARLSPRQALLLTCLPGFSTAREVTDTSGRGVGMDVVKTTLQSLGGNLAIESVPEGGSRFTLSLPLTISIIQILLVSCASLVVAFPVSKILRTIDIRRDDLIKRSGKNLFRLGDQEVPLVSLHRLLGLQFPPIRSSSIPAVMAEVRGRGIGLVVDRFIGQQDVFVKPLGRPLNRMKGISGSAILGDGQVICILDPAELV